MGLRLTAALAGLAGGLVWIAAWVLDRSGALVVAGLVLVAIATLGAGASLVSSSAAWLRLIVAVCFTALVGSILSLLTEHYDDQAVYGVFGVLAVAASVVALTRPRPPAGGHVDTHRAGGTHSR